MGLFFWQFQDINDIEREWICFVLNAMVFVFALVAMARSWLFHRKLVFEVIPLTFNLLSTIALLLLKLFEKGYQFDLIGYLIEIFTYFLVAFTFAVIFFKTKSSQKTSLKLKCYISIFIVILTIVISMIFLIGLKVIDRSCDRNLFLISVLTLSCEALTFMPALYNAKKIIKLLNQKKHSSLTQTMLSDHISIKNSLSDQFTIERKKQIYAVMIIYGLSLLIRTFLLIISISIEDSDLVQCENVEGIMIITSDYFLGQLVLILIEINQLLPHIIIPIAIFVVPMRSKNKTQGLLVKKQSQTWDDSDEENSMDSKDQFIKSKVSSVFSDKLDSPRR